MSTSLDQLKASGTVVVSDSGDFETIAVYKPQDATTNPSLILAAVNKPAYSKLVDTSIEWAKQKGGSIDDQVSNAMDRLLVEFGKEILKIVPGRVSTEVDAALSYDKEATVAKAKQIIALYEAEGVDRNRVLIKIASTWEGIQAARELERDHNIHCNLTLLFGFGQAVACAEAGVTLISPFVGRILDWYKAAYPDKADSYVGEADPGVQSVQKIFNYYKQHDYKTIVMGASFRNVGEIKALAGCDYLTIAPKLLQELMDSNEDVPKKLESETARRDTMEKVSFVDDKEKFMADLKADRMANDKLKSGIEGFDKDGKSLKDNLREKLSK